MLSIGIKIVEMFIENPKEICIVTSLEEEILYVLNNLSAVLAELELTEKVINIKQEQDEITKEKEDHAVNIKSDINSPAEIKFTNRNDLRARLDSLSSKDKFVESSVFNSKQQQQQQESEFLPLQEENPINVHPSKKEARPFMCDLCGTAYRQKGTLERHKLTHSKVNKFACSTCGKYFRYKHYLAQHERVHNGVQPFKCAQCEKSFSQRSNLLKHEKQKHYTDQEEYTCPICNKGHVASYYLRRHMTTHDREGGHSGHLIIMDTGPTAEACYGIRTVRCDHCSVTVKNLTNLKKHMKDYHAHLDVDTELQRRDPLFLQ